MFTRGVTAILLFSYVAMCSILAADSVSDDPYAPVQHRLAFAGDNGMVVSWNTYTSISNPTVKYGKLPDKLENSATGCSATYQTSKTWNNHVKLNGLEPNTVYYYTVLADETGSCVDEIYNFTSAPKVGQKDDFSFALVVDMGTMGRLGLSETAGKKAGGVLLPDESNTVESLSQSLDQFKFLWHPGDIAYADYWLKEEIQGYLPMTSLEEGVSVYEDILNDFYEQMKDVTAFKPYMVGPGNHEANCDNGKTKDKMHNITYTADICMPGQSNFTGLINHFKMPSEESGGKTNMWYSFDFGMAHFVQFNTETDLGNGLIGPDEPGGFSRENAGPFGLYPNEQVDWLESDLKSVDSKKTPWVIVAGHRPWYVSAQEGGCMECQQAFEDMFVRYEVDVAIFGHVHNYQRLSPIAHGKIDPNGLDDPAAPWYILNGAAGHYDGMDPLVYPTPDYFEYGFDNTYGWSKFTIHNETHLTHEFIASRNNTVMDSATLFKLHNK